MQYCTIINKKPVQMFESEKGVKKVMASFDFINACENIVVA